MLYLIQHKLLKFMLEKAKFNKYLLKIMFTVLYQLLLK